MRGGGRALGPVRLGALDWLVLGLLMLGLGCAAPTESGGEDDSDDDDGDGAIASASSSGSSGAVGAGGGSATSAGPAGPGGSSTSGPSSSGVGANGCTSEPTHEACVDCIVAADPAGEEAATVAFYLACACNASAGCWLVCAGTDMCPASGVVDLGALDQSCVDCSTNLYSDDPCMETYANNCLIDPACQNFVTALQSCPP